MKKLFGLFILFLICCISLVSCGSDDDNKFSFKLSDDGTYYILTSCNVNDVTEVEIPSEHDGKTVKVIGQDAMSSIKKITKLNIPEGVEVIEDSAFRDCTSVIELTLPATLKSIGRFAFLNCTSLTSVTIPANVEEIGDRAFSGCNKIVEVYNLSNLNIEAESSENGEIALNAITVNEDKSVPSLLKVEGEYQIITLNSIEYIINYMGNASKIVLPDENYVIYDYAFDYRVNLKEVVISDSITTIGDYAFSNCKYLEKVEMENVSNIGDYAFNECSRLKSLAFYCDMTIGEGAFYECQELESVDFTYADIKEIKPKTFSYNLALKDIVLPDGLIAIGDNAFDNCESLETINIPSTTTNIGEQVFVDCNSNLVINCEAPYPYDTWAEDWYSYTYTINYNVQ
ncbi:MAG: leucine-rich repeat domain-containing protein [Acholeplasmatales bacterium]|nr:leucine-rich repeat domain-containing protein [Acholeplasmatales bacterium]